MRIYHATVAGEGTRIGVDEWNEQHVISDLDDYINRFGCYPARRGTGTVTEKTGEYTLNLTYTPMGSWRRLGVRLKLQLTSTDSNPVTVKFRVNGDTTTSRYTGDALKWDSSGSGVISIASDGFNLLEAPPLGSGVERSMWFVNLECWVRGEVFSMKGEASSAYPSTVNRSLLGAYVKATDFTAEPGLSLVFPDNSYLEVCEWEVFCD